MCACVRAVAVVLVLTAALLVGETLAFFRRFSLAVAVFVRSCAQPLSGAAALGSECPRGRTVFEGGRTRERMAHACMYYAMSRAKTLYKTVQIFASRYARKVTKHPKKFRFALRAKGRVNLRFYCAARAQRRGTREGQQQRESSLIWLAFLTLRFEAGAPSNI